MIVTNGGSRQQRMKIDRAGLTDIVSGSAVSGELKCKKPDPRIFAAARRIAGNDKAAWMVDDHVDADMEGAHAVGLSTAWVSHGRAWSKSWAPAVMGCDPAQVLSSVAEALKDPA